MKTKYWILALAALLVVCLGLSLTLLMPGADSRYAEIHSDGKHLKTVDLLVEQEFTVTTADGGFNVVQVKEGKIAVVEASCPDHYCMKRGFCSSGAQIVCLPNRLIIRFPGQSAVDAVAQ